MSYPLIDNRIPDPFDRMYHQMMASLEQAEKLSDQPVAAAAQAAQLALESILILKEYVLKEGFADRPSEITFFKQVKPLFVRWLLYYQQVYQLEAGRPVGGKEVEINFLEKKLRSLEQHYEDHAELYQYLRQNATHLDELYFLRQEAPSAIIISTVKADADPRFSTPRDYAVAVILKNALIEDYLVRALHKLRGTEGSPANAAKSDGLFWTGPINGLGLLLRTLVKAGYINNGNVALTKVVEHAEDFLHVKMNNFSRAIQETRIKKDPYEFFKGLIKVSEADFNSQDDNPRYR